jgi:catechol 2,3-dioxygenase-like lactoylglutathione lyase family enzyme
MSNISQQPVTTTARAIGIDFIGLQVRDVTRSARFYEQVLGLSVVESRLGAVVFASSPIPVAVRETLPGTDLDAGPVGLGVGLWFHTDDPDALHVSLVAAGVEVVAPPADGPFGRHLVVRDPDGYLLTLHGSSDGSGS